MNNMAPDQVVRDIAIDIKQSFIVQAPAGAGKTSLLTQRILALLAVVENPEEIVAVTFTRKAAAEMRNRVIEALEASLGAEPEALHEQKSWQLAQQVMQRDKLKSWQLLENPHRLRILTIDSLSSLIANQMPLMSRLGGSLAIAEFPQDSYQEAAQTVLGYLNDEDYAQDICRLLAHLDNQVERLIGLLAKMLAKRDQWLRLLGAGDLNVQLLQDGIREIAQLRLEKLSEFSFQFENSNLLQALHFAAGHIDKGHALDALKSIENLPEFDADHLIQWKAIADFCLTTSGGTFRKSLSKKQGLPADKDLKGEDKVVGKNIKVELKALFTEWSEVAGFAEALQDINNFPMAKYNNEQQQILASLLKLLRLVTIELNLNFQTKAEVDFIEVALAADRALGYFDDPSELALKLDYQISHILVDEFQDTSFTQYQLLNKLIAGWQADDGRTLFLVGDPMQSIYRFREANVGLFIKTQAEGIGQVAITPLRLEANFRSSQQIIDWVNQQFKTIFPQQNDALLGAVNYSPAIAMQQLDEPSYVKFMSSFAGVGDAEYSESELIAQEIIKLQQQDKAQSIAILVRARSHAEAISQALIANNIQFYAKDMQLLKYKPVIGDLICMARLLLQPQDNIAWAAFIKSPYLGFELEQLMRLNERFGHNFWQWLDSIESASGTNERLLLVANLLQDSIKQQGRLPLSQIIESLWLRLAGPSALLDSHGLEEYDAFIKVLIELEQQDVFLTIENIEAALSDLYAEHQKSANAVEIMTMHKSKGLEFDTVFLPALEKRKRADEHQLLLWEEFSSSGQQHYLLAPIQAHEQQEPIYQLARDIQQKKAQFEDARLLYVAATRAKKRLYLSCQLTTRNNKKTDDLEYTPISKLSLLSYLQPHYQQAIDTSFESITLDEAIEEESDDFDQTWYRVSERWKLPEISNELQQSKVEELEVKELEFDWASDTARVVGLVVHQILEFIAKGYTSFEQILAMDLSVAKRQINNLLDDPHEQEMALSKVKGAIDLMMQDEQVDWMLKPHKAAVSEWSLHGVVTLASGETELKHCIIDRSFIDETGVRWVIDYKTGQHLGSDLDGFFANEVERYKPQLDKYEQLISQLESHPIKKALYFPMHKKMVMVK